MRKIICVFLTVLMLCSLWGCQSGQGNAGSTKTQTQSLTQQQLQGTWTLRFSYAAFFKNMAAMKNVPQWVQLMPNVSSKAKFQMTFTFHEDGTCTSVADPEAVMLATEQFAADVLSYLYNDGVYDLLHLQHGWSKSLADKKLKEQEKTVQEFADESMASMLPGLESLFAEMAVETTVDYTLEGPILTLLSEGETLSRLFCSYDGAGEVVFKQDSPGDVCFYAGMSMTKEQ